VLRVSIRLGLLLEKAGYERGFRTLMRLVPDEWDAGDLYELHWLIKMHGQTTCRYKHPACSGCPVAQLCLMPHKTAVGSPE
jgi:endonuclease-3